MKNVLIIGTGGIGRRHIKGYLSTNRASLSIVEPDDEKKNIVQKERMHGDGINYDINSPEAFDEIFFNCNDNFTKNELINYLRLILISEKQNRYFEKRIQFLIAHS